MNKTKDLKELWETVNSVMGPIGVEDNNFLCMDTEDYRIQGNHGSPVGMAYNIVIDECRGDGCEPDEGKRRRYMRDL
jgi:hypothetical protein